MLSFTKTFTAFPLTHNPCPFRLPRHVPFHMSLGSNSSDNGNNNNIITSTTTRSTSNGNNVASGGQGSIDDASPSAQSLRITPPDTVEIRFKRGSRKRRKQEEQEGMQADKMQSNKALSSRSKDWDSMTLTEKLVELYMGEKGMLFWLNKFAYASIFIVIGGWILFRFVGPALNLYQLDTPPLAPTSMFK